MKLLTTVIFCFTAFCGQSAQAAIINLLPVDDGDASSVSPPAGDGSWNLNPDDIILSLYLSSSTYQETRAALEFDISAVPLGSTITASTLELTKTVFNANVGIYGYDGNGAIEAGDFIDSFTMIDSFAPVGGLNRRNVTSFLQERFSLGQLSTGFQLRELNDDHTAEFYSSNVSDTEFQPRLIIEYTLIPLPTALYLFGSGLLGLIGIAKHKKTS